MKPTIEEHLYYYIEDLYEVAAHIDNEIIKAELISRIEGLQHYLDSLKFEE